MVGPRDWPHAGAVLAAGAEAYLVYEPTGDPGVVAATIVAGAPQRPDTAPARLSRRERETLAYIAAGHTHGQAARRMNVSKATVDTFVARIKTKLAVGNKADLTRAALALGSGPPGPA